MTAALRFCVARFERDRQTLARWLEYPEAMLPTLVRDHPDVWVEVLQSGPDLAVLLSMARAGEATLRCVLGFSNSPVWCDLGRLHGFPMSEAVLALDDKGTLKVTAPRFVEADAARGDASSLQFGDLIELTGLFPDLATTASEYSGEVPEYEQDLSSPDGAQPASRLMTVPRRTAAQQARCNIRAAEPGGVQVRFDRARYPDLAALLGNPLTSAKVLTGDFDESKLAQPQPPDVSPVRVPCKSVFGPPAFRFEEVELIGFRLDLARAEDAQPTLREMIARLNFHHDRLFPEAGCAMDFEYRVATQTVIVELLRYGKMKSLRPMPPIEAQDYMAQHELVCRVLVGRVDDDTSQARDSATFVPAIFVDNPWSRAVGRELQGFPKELAEFCCLEPPGRRVVLGMDGRAAGQSDPKPLVDVSQIRLVSRVRADGQSEARPLLDIEYNPGDFDDTFEPIDLPTLLGTGLLAQSPWRQFDFFDSKEFRRSFARDNLLNGFQRFGSVQVTPLRAGDVTGAAATTLDARPHDLPQAWITGEIRLREVAVQFPVGIARLTMSRAGMDASHPWSLLCRLLGATDAGPATVELPTGEWYRVRCAMDLDIEDGLDF